MKEKQKKKIQQDREMYERNWEENCREKSIGSDELFRSCMERGGIDGYEPVYMIEREWEENCREKSIGSDELFESCMNRELTSFLMKNLP